MQSQMAQIQIHTKDAEQHIRQPQADLTMQQRPAEVNIHTKPGKLTIDQTEAFADMNLMSILRRNDMHADAGNAAMIEGIDSNPIAAQAKRNSEREARPLGIEFIPSHFSVKIDYEPADVQFDVKTNKPIIEAKPNKPTFEYVPWSVETSLKQPADLQVEFINVTV